MIALGCHLRVRRLDPPGVDQQVDRDEDRPEEQDAEVERARREAGQAREQLPGQRLDVPEQVLADPREHLVRRDGQGAVLLQGPEQPPKVAIEVGGDPGQREEQVAELPDQERYQEDEREYEDPNSTETVASIARPLGTKRESALTGMESTRASAPPQGLWRRHPKRSAEKARTGRE